MIKLTGEIKKRIKRCIKEKKYESILKEINAYPVEKYSEKIKNEPKVELQKLTEEQKKNIKRFRRFFFYIFC